MPQLLNIETQVLIDMLAQHTERLTQLFSKGDFGGEYERSRNLVDEIQSEIEQRNKPSPVTLTTNDNSFNTQQI